MLESPIINVSPATAVMADESSVRTRLDIASIKNRIPPALLLGGHSVSDPPDPISNSAVKPDCADGTNAQALEE